MRLYWWFYWLIRKPVLRLGEWVKIIISPIKYMRLKKVEQECREAFKDFMIDYNQIDPNVVKWQVVLECKEDSGMGRLLTIKGQEGIPSEEWDVNWKSIAEISEEENA